MDKSKLTSFINAKSKDDKLPDVLPAFHTCQGLLGLKILQDETLKIKYCNVFKKDLLYFFYGKPAYPVKSKNDKSGTNPLLCPICFIVNTQKINFYEVYPFDTGAFDAGMYDEFINNKFNINDYKVESNIQGILSYIKVMFGDNENYIKRESTITEDATADEEINALISLLNCDGEYQFDERACTVEIISNKNYAIKDVVECIILPNAVLRDENVKNVLDKNNIKYITYSYRTLTKPTLYNGVILEKAEEYIRGREEV